MNSKAGPPKRQAARIVTRYLEPRLAAGGSLRGVERRGGGSEEPGRQLGRSTACLPSLSLVQLEFGAQPVRICVYRGRDFRLIARFFAATRVSRRRYAAVDPECAHVDVCHRERGHRVDSRNKAKLPARTG